jgi:hypothetical protein
MKNSWLFLILSMTLISCWGNTVESIKTKSSPASATPQTIEPSSPTLKKSKPPTSDDFLISVKGIGSAQLGITLKQLKRKLGTDTKFQAVSPFMVDFDAIAVYQSGMVQYYILYPSGTNFSDSDPIELLLTDSPNYRTAEGVGAGIPVKQAEAIYGGAILSYNTQNESREQVRFSNYSSPNISFQPTIPNQSFAGIYPSSSEEYNETKQFQDQAVIRSILVSR